MNVASNIIVIGGSAGSLEVIIRLLPKLMLPLNTAVVIIMHRKISQDSSLIELLSAKAKIKLQEAEEKEHILSGVIYVAPADYHLLIEEDKTFSLDYSEKLNYSRPSIDVSFQCAAEVFGHTCIAVLLSGANADGANGLKSVIKNGGKAFVQNPYEAEVDYMPRQAIQENSEAIVVNSTEMANLLNLQIKQ